MVLGGEVFKKYNTDKIEEKDFIEWMKDHDLSFGNVNIVIGDIYKSEKFYPWRSLTATSNYSELAIASLKDNVDSAMIQYSLNNFDLGNNIYSDNWISPGSNLMYGAFDESDFNLIKVYLYSNMYQHAEELGIFPLHEDNLIDISLKDSTGEELIVNPSDILYTYSKNDIWFPKPWLDLAVLGLDFLIKQSTNAPYTFTLTVKHPVLDFEVSDSFSFDQNDILSGGKFLSYKTYRDSKLLREVWNEDALIWNPALKSQIPDCIEIGNMVSIVNIPRSETNMLINWHKPYFILLQERDVDLQLNNEVPVVILNDKESKTANFIQSSGNTWYIKNNTILYALYNADWINNTTQGELTDTYLPDRIYQIKICPDGTGQNDDSLHTNYWNINLSWDSSENILDYYKIENQNTYYDVVQNEDNDFDLAPGESVTMTITPVFKYLDIEIEFKPLRFVATNGYLL